MIIEACNIQLKKTVADWRSALRLAGEPLVGSGYITEEYILSIIQSVEELGPYIVLSPGFALAHARPDKSVKKPGISLLTLDTPVEFGCENDPVRIIITLAATDDHSHLDMLAAVANLLSDSASVVRINGTMIVEEIVKMFEMAETLS